MIGKAHEVVTSLASVVEGFFQSFRLCCIVCRDDSLTWGARNATPRDLLVNF